MSEKYIYSGNIKHTEKTIQNLFKTQYFTFEKWRIAGRFSVGILLIIAAVSLNIPVWARCLLLIPGTWLAVSGDFPAQVTADKVLQARKNKLPVMNYEFYGDHIKISGEGEMNIDYKNLKFLVQDDEYLYLFIAKNSVCMIEKSSLENLNEFKSFIQNKTGLEWTRQKNFMAMNINDLKQIFRAK